MIDWSKPLYTTAFTGHTVYFIGFTPDGEQAVVQSSSGALYKAYRTTGQLVNSSTTVKNKREDWEEAWLKWNGQPVEQDYSVQQTFKEAFELGRTWDTGQNKKS